MIKKADRTDLDAAAGLALLLWPEHTVKEMQALFGQLLRSQEAVVFTAFEQDEAVGFAQCQLRHDYVEGTEASPVGYLEGIYVKENRRRKGIARSLLQSCGLWAKKNGCTEFASDCELGNSDSLNFHLNSGFSEANRIICFTKKL